MYASSPIWPTQPTTTSSTSCGLTPARWRASFSTRPASSRAGTSFKPPPKRPMGERTPLAMTTRSAIGAPPPKGKCPKGKCRGLVAASGIHHVLQRLAAAEPAQVLDENFRRLIVVPRGVRAQMGRDEHVGHVPQRRVRGQRLFHEDVQARS